MSSIAAAREQGTVCIEPWVRHVEGDGALPGRRRNASLSAPCKVTASTMGLHKFDELAETDSERSTSWHVIIREGVV